MSVETIHVQPTVTEEFHTETPPTTLQRLTEVPPPLEYAPPSAFELLPPPGLTPPPGLSLPLGLQQPTEVKEVTPEMKELLDSVSLELTKIADNFASSEFMIPDQKFGFESGSAMLPFGLHGVGMYPPGLYEDENDTQSMDESDARSISEKMDGNESSDESTNADSILDESAKTDSNPDEDESNDEVPELPDLSSKGLSTRKKQKLNAKRIADNTANTIGATTRIVFGDQGAKLAAQAAMLATNGCGYADVRPWQLPPGTSAYSWHPYYGYAAW